MQNKEIRELSKENVKKNGLFSIIIFFFAALVISAFTFLNLLIEGLIIIIIPLIVLPTMFAFQRAIIVLREENTLSFSLIFGGYRQYFTNRFRSNYAFFKTLIKLIIIYFSLTFITFIVLFIVFLNTNYLGMREMYEEMSHMNINMETMQILLEEYGDLFDAIHLYTDLPALFITSLMALFFYSRNSISFFMRISGVNYSGAYISSLHQLMIRNNKKAFYQAFFSLNWPIFLLFILGFGLGGYVGYLYHFTFNTIFTFALAFSIFIPFALFGFKYFANKEAIYFAFIDQYREADEMVNKATSARLEEMKRKEEEYQKFLKELEELESDEDDSDESDE